MLATARLVPRLCLHGCVHWLLLEPDTQLQQLAITVIARRQGLSAESKPVSSHRISGFQGVGPGLEVLGLEFTPVDKRKAKYGGLIVIPIL